VFHLDGGCFAAAIIEFLHKCRVFAEFSNGRGSQCHGENGYLIVAGRWLFCLKRFRAPGCGPSCFGQNRKSVTMAPRTTTAVFGPRLPILFQPALCPATLALYSGSTPQIPASVLALQECYEEVHADSTIVSIVASEWRICIRIIWTLSCWNKAFAICVDDGKVEKVGRTSGGYGGSWNPDPIHLQSGIAQ
jgi:hypothetical protein